MTELPTATASAWLRCFRRRPRARHRLVCLPHAGGSATFFRHWPDHLPDQIEVHAVQYPGHEDRYGEPCVTDLHRLADLVTDVITTMTAGDNPVALFGHSMGAAVAHEAARRLQRAGTPPSHLFVSGHPAPHHHRPGEVHRTDDDTLLAEVHRLGGTPVGALADPELREIILPALRADYQAIESYRPEWQPPVSCRITAFAPVDDPEVTVAEMRAWQSYTTGAFDLRTVAGGHFYLTEHLPALARDVAARLGPSPWDDLP